MHKLRVNLLSSTDLYVFHTIKLALSSNQTDGKTTKSLFSHGSVSKLSALSKAPGNKEEKFMRKIQTYDKYADEVLRSFDL